MTQYKFSFIMCKSTVSLLFFYIKLIAQLEGRKKAFFFHFIKYNLNMYAGIMRGYLLVYISRILN